jgi:hypothetical protein
VPDEGSQQVSDHSAGSASASDFRASTSARVWHQLWRWFPNFSAKHSPYYFFADGCVICNRGFGQLSFVKCDKSISIGWGLDGQHPVGRVIYLSQIANWDPPHQSIALSEAERDDLRDRLQALCMGRRERVTFM